MKIKGNFLINVITKSIPSAVTVVLDVLIVMLFSSIFKFNSYETSTMAVLLVAFTGFILLFKICYPFSKLRMTLYISLIALFIVCILILHNIFDLVILNPFQILTMASLCILDIAIFTELSYLFDKKIRKIINKKTR